MTVIPQAVTHSRLITTNLQDIFFVLTLNASFLVPLTATILQHQLGVDGTYWKVLRHCYQSLTHLEDLIQKPFYLYSFLLLKLHVWLVRYIYSQNTNDQLLQHTLSGWVYLFIKQITFYLQREKRKEDTCGATTTEQVNWKEVLQCTPKHTREN